MGLERSNISGSTHCSQRRTMIQTISKHRASKSGFSLSIQTIRRETERERRRQSRNGEKTPENEERGNCKRTRGMSKQSASSQSFSHRGCCHSIRSKEGRGYHQINQHMASSRISRPQLLIIQYPPKQTPRQYAINRFRANWFEPEHRHSVQSPSRFPTDSARNQTNAVPLCVVTAGSSTASSASSVRGAWRLPGPYTTGRGAHCYIHSAAESAS